jgi:hypothetical protein
MPNNKIAYTKADRFDVETAPLAIAEQTPWTDGSDKVIGDVWVVGLNADGSVYLDTSADPHFDQDAHHSTEVFGSEVELDAYMAERGFVRLA